MARPIASPETVEARFWAQVEKTDGCWLWSGATQFGGYGTMKVGGRRGRLIRCHRYSYELVYGRVPLGLNVLHHCDTPACVNPDHLYAGSQADNIADAQSRGRWRHGATGPRHPARGERVGSARLTLYQVREIRRIAGTMTRRALGERFGVSHHAINQIVNRKTWTHV